MGKVQLPHPVIAPAAMAMETMIHFQRLSPMPSHFLPEPEEMQSYCVEPIASCFAAIGRHGDNLRTNPSVAYMSWDDAHYIAVAHDEIGLVYIWDVTTNIICRRTGDDQTADIMAPVLRGGRTAYRPTISELGRFLRDTVFETNEMREARNAALIAEMDAEGFEVDICDDSCACDGRRWHRESEGMVEA